MKPRTFLTAAATFLALSGEASAEGAGKFRLPSVVPDCPEGQVPTLQPKGFTTNPGHLPVQQQTQDRVHQITIDLDTKKADKPAPAPKPLAPSAGPIAQVEWKCVKDETAKPTKIVPLAFLEDGEFLYPNESIKRARDVHRKVDLTLPLPSDSNGGGRILIDYSIEGSSKMPIDSEVKATEDRIQELGLCLKGGVSTNCIDGIYYPE